MAFVFQQVTCIAVALGAARLVTLKISMGPLGPGGVFLVFACTGATGAFAGGFFRKPILGAVAGVLSVPLLLVLAIFVAAFLLVRK